MSAFGPAERHSLKTHTTPLPPGWSAGGTFAPSSNCTGASKVTTRPSNVTELPRTVYNRLASCSRSPCRRFGVGHTSGLGLGVRVGGWLGLGWGWVGARLGLGWG